MPQPMEIFVKDTKTRVITGCFGLVEIWLAVMTQYWEVHPWHGSLNNLGSPLLVLVFTLLCAHQGTSLLVLGLWGGFPPWSHAFIPRLLREVYVRWYKARAAAGAAARLNPASPYKWGSCAQVRWLQWGLVVLIGGLAALSSIVVDVPGVLAGVMGACVGGLAAMALSHFLER